MDEPVWTNSMCNKLGRLSQGWGKHAVTDIIEFIFHKGKPKERKSSMQHQTSKIETHRTRLTAVGNMIYYPGEVSTPT